MNTSTVIRRIFVMSLFLVGLAAGAAAQPPLGSGARGSFPGCPQCGVWSWVDLPQNQQTVSASNFWVHGWGFECVSGLSIDRVDVHYQDYDGIWRPLKQPVNALRWGLIPRPDVVTFGQAIGCPHTVANTGWALTVHGMPLGLRRVTFNVWRGPYLETHERTYLVRR